MTTTEARSWLQVTWLAWWYLTALLLGGQGCQRSSFQVLDVTWFTKSQERLGTFSRSSEHASYISRLGFWGKVAFLCCSKFHHYIDLSKRASTHSLTISKELSACLLLSKAQGILPNAALILKFSLSWFWQMVFGIAGEVSTTSLSVTAQHSSKSLIKWKRWKTRKNFPFEPAFFDALMMVVYTPWNFLGIVIMTLESSKMNSLPCEVVR